MKVVNSTSGSSIGGMLSKPIYLSKIEDSGILCVEIKFTYIQNNTKSKAKATLWVFIDIEV